MGWEWRFFFPLSEDSENFDLFKGENKNKPECRSDAYIATASGQVGAKLRHGSNLEIKLQTE